MEIRSRRSILTLLFDGELDGLAPNVVSNVPRAITRRRHTIQPGESNIIPENNTDFHRRTRLLTSRFHFYKMRCVVCGRTFVSHNEDLTCGQRCANFLMWIHILKTIRSIRGFHEQKNLSVMLKTPTLSRHIPIICCDPFISAQENLMWFWKFAGHSIWINKNPNNKWNSRHVVIFNNVSISNRK